MQLKYSLKKEWAQFSRTFRLWGIIIAALATALLYILMFKFTGAIFESMEQMGEMSMSAASGGNLFGDLGINMDDMIAMYLDAGMMYSVVMSSICSIALLVIVLVLGSAAGGEQKKRAMIVPLCSGLDNKSYVLAKFIVYPISVFVIIFLTALLSGVLCNALFPNNKVGFDLVLLGSVLAGIYMTFAVSIFLSLGLCTSKPGIMAAIVYIGTTILQTVFIRFQLYDYNPFTLLNLISGEMFANPEFSLADNAASIAVGVVISLLISVLMCLLAIAVLNAKKINNQEEKKPEF